MVVLGILQIPSGCSAPSGSRPCLAYKNPKRSAYQFWTYKLMCVKIRIPRLCELPRTGREGLFPGLNVAVWVWEGDQVNDNKNKWK